METKILKQENNHFLHRTELLIEIKSDSAPSFDEIKKDIEKNENLVVIKSIDGHFGEHIFRGKVFIYENEKFKNEIEIIPKKIRKKLEEEAKKAEEAKQEQTEESSEKQEQETEKTEETEIKESQENKEE